MKAWFESTVQPYWLRHIIIALVIQLGLAPLIGIHWSTFVAVVFYGLHELDDLFRLHKNNNEPDWMGFFPPATAVLFVHYLWTVAALFFGLSI